jgi:hypothetical protein
MIEKQRQRKAAGKDYEKEEKEKEMKALKEERNQKK